MAHKCDVYRIARNCGVNVKRGKGNNSSDRLPRECYCFPTLKEIGVKYGEGHLRLVLVLLCGTRANSTCLFADVLKAVSEVLAACPDIERRLDLFDRFNGIDFPALRKQARALNMGMPAFHVIQCLLMMRLSGAATGLKEALDYDRI